MSKVYQNLIFLERQYNTIKGLIPVANTCLAASSTPHKLIKSFSHMHASHWDIIQSAEKKKDWQVNLSKEEEGELSEKILAMMNLLIQVKRTSQVANQSQKSHKVALYELLLRLRDQVLKDNPSELIPSFLNTVVPKTSKKLNIPKLKWSISQKKNKDKQIYELWSREIRSAAIPEFVTTVLQKQLQDLYHLSHIGKIHETQWEKDLTKYGSLQKRSLTGGKEYESKAYGVICEMITVNTSLHQSLRDRANRQYKSFLIGTEEMIRNYKELYP